MRIAVVHSFYTSATPSGENQVVLDQCSALRDQGHDVRLVRRDTDDLQTSRTYQVRAAVTTMTGRGADPAIAVAGWRPDVVHLHNTFPNWGTQWLPRWRDRLVVTLHNYRTVCAAGTLFRDGHECHDCLEASTAEAVRHACYRSSRLRTLPLAVATKTGGTLNRIPREAQRVVVLNEGARDLFSRHLARPIDLVPNFVAESRPGPDDQDAWVYVGRLDEAKGVVTLLRQWPRTRRLFVFGTGPQTHLVSELASASGGSITYGGLLPRNELLAKMPSFTGLVLPSLWTEGLPTVVLEALAAGLPLVVASPVAAAAGLAAAGASLTYDPSRHETLHGALEQATERRAGMSRAAVALHAGRYSKDAWLRSMTGLYEEVAMQRGGDSG